MRGNSSISSISSPSRIGLPMTSILPLPTASGNVASFADVSFAPKAVAHQCFLAAS
jgi:hypothetical protein